MFWNPNLSEGAGVDHTRSIRPYTRPRHKGATVSALIVLFAE